ncbi:MAG: hypothetical protein KIS78_28810 [Labilithrix sp.]|nr:hypothetical protein [Labilithrix sp.]MCW5836435.1 hypothetical protein [Labilithrix sp.]
MRRVLRAAASAVVLAASPALAGEGDTGPDPRSGTGAATTSHVKDIGVHTPRGRRLYRDEEPLERILDSRRRIFVIEAVAGSGSEGNLGLVLGWMPREIKGIEFFAGVGLDVSPAVHVSGATRFLFNFRGVRPYVGVGYFYKGAFAIETYSHNVFLELGHSWKLGPTNHLTVGAGVARLLHTGVDEDSPLRSPNVDPASLEAQTKLVPPYLPLFAARFSRAF